MLAVAAVALPVAGLLWAAHEARIVVVDRVFAGETATAQGVAAEVARSLTQAHSSIAGIAARPSVVDGLAAGTPRVVDRSLAVSIEQEPVTLLAIYGADGRLVTSVGAPAQPTLAAARTVGQTGRLRPSPSDTLLQEEQPIVATDGRALGTLVAEVSFARAVPDLARQHFGRTGASLVIDSDGVVLLSGDATQGLRALAPTALEFAAGRVPAAGSYYSPRLGRDIVTAYVPVPLPGADGAGMGLGVISRQDESEAFAGANHLVHLLWIGAGVAGVLGVGLVLAMSVAIRRQRRRLEARDSEIRELVAGSGDLIARYDEQLLCTWISPSVEAMTGFRPEECLGKDPYLRIHRDDLTGFRAGLARLRTQDSVTSSYRSRHRDGHWTWFEATTTVDRAVSGRITAYNAITRDVTARRKVELELIRTADLRTQAVADAARARDEALAASRAKTAFLANTSHEVRTPLVGVLGLTELLLGTGLDRQQRDWALTVQQSGRQLLAVLDDVLDLAKIEAGRVVLEDAAFDVVQVVRHAVAAVRPTAEALGLEVGFTAPVPSRWVRGDARRLGQVLANLLGNAVKFTPTGSITTTLSWPAEHGSELVVTVADTGVGIAGERLGALFQPFVQEDASTTRRFGGTGLGLSVSRQLAELLGGSLSAESVHGAGSTFTLRLSLPPAREPAGPEPAVTPASRPAHSGLRVLLAEDNPVNQKVGMAMLDRLGYSVEVVADGSAAVSAVAADPGGFVAVLMDCQMPVLDGYGATAAIRSLPGAAGAVPILALTASAMLEERVRGIEVGMDGYLTKPISLKELEAALDRVLPTPRAAT